MTFSYQFNPALYNPDVTINVLIKSLTVVPLPDFNLCIALLGERPVATNLDEPDPLPTLLPHLTNLHGLLLQCRFPVFWALYKSAELETLRDNYTVEIAGFEDSIREVVVRAIKATFKKINADRLSTYLDLSGTCIICALKAFCAESHLLQYKETAWSSMLQGLGGLLRGLS